MMLPLYICRECGRYAGLALSFSQSFAKLAAGEKIEEGKPARPACPNGHGEMYEVQDEDRLAVVGAEQKSIERDEKGEA